MSVFTVDFDRWVALMLPTFMRKKRLFAFIRALCSPAYLGSMGIYRRFLAARSDHIFRLTYNGQVCHLRAALNERFGLAYGFEIADAMDYEGEWQYAKDAEMARQLMAVAEGNAKRADGRLTPLLADEARLNMAMNAFIVYVPSAIYDTRLEEVKAVVEQFRLPSKVAVYTRTKTNPFYYKEKYNEQSRISFDASAEWRKWAIPLVDART